MKFSPARPRRCWPRDPTQLDLRTRARPSRTSRPAPRGLLAQILQATAHRPTSRIRDLSEFVGSGNFSFLESLFQYRIINYDPGISVAPIFHDSVFTLGYAVIGGRSR
jgi:hypothetical protein